MIRWLRLRRMGGFNPFYSPSLVAHEAMKWAVEGFAKGYQEGQEVYERGAPEEIAAFEKKALRGGLRAALATRPKGIRIGKTIFMPAPYENIELEEE